MNLRKTSEKTLALTIKIAVWLLLIVILYTLGLKGFQFGEDIFSETGVAEKPGETKIIVINEQDSNMDVAKKAVDVGIAKDKWVFYIQSLLYDAKFKSYEYSVDNSLSSQEIIDILSTEPTTAEGEE